MTRLAQLRRCLDRLRRRRRGVRRAIAYSAVAIALGWTLAAAFLADWLLDLSRLQRAVVLLAAAGLLAWAVRRFALPWLGQRETLVDVALLVQKQEHIDSDLVAAIQFESAEASRWGSVQLEQAVIDRVAGASKGLRPLLGLPRERMRRRLALAAATALVLAAAAGRYPDHARVFLHRLLLDSRHYPTRTIIDSVAINGRTIDLDGPADAQVPAAYGLPVRFVVAGQGELPLAGEARVRSASSGLEVAVLLEPGTGPGVFAGELPRLIEPAVCQFYLGDAWTDPIRLEMLLPPVVDVELDVTSPAYAGAEGAPTRQTLSGLRQLAVAQGSRVHVRILADKPLERAEVTIEGSRHETVCQGPLADNSARELWALDPRGTPLESLTEPIRYVIQVRDADGLELERPIEGVIRVKVDHPPQIAGSALTQLVLPTARPTISLSASDDYGLSQVAILAEVVRADGSPGGKAEQVVHAIPAGQAPLKSFQVRHRLSLTQLQAGKGDQVKVTLRAIDFRGAGQEGKPALSEPLLFQVTDERGIYAAMAEVDRESARQLQAMIEQQIDVGEGK